MIPSAHLGPQLPSSILEALSQPFSHLDVQLRAGALREKENQWFCQALPHVPRWIYEERLHQAAPGGWGTLSPYVVVADDRLTLAVQVRVGPVIHTSCGEIHLPRLDVPDTLGEIIASVPDAYSVAFIDACHRFGLGRYLLHLSRRWVPYERERQAMKLTREEQRTLIQKLYQDAGLPLNLPATEMKPIGRAEAAGRAGAGSRERDQSAEQPESLEEARTHKRASELALIEERCDAQTRKKLLNKYRLHKLEDISEANLTEVIQWLNQRQAS